MDHGVSSTLAALAALHCRARTQLGSFESSQPPPLPCRQSCPHAPQFVVVFTAVSQPSSAVGRAGCLQSPNAALHAGVQAPFTHAVPDALAFEQAYLHAPQLAASLWPSTSHPFLPSASQSRCVASQLALQTPALQTAPVVPAGVHAMAQVPQRLGSLLRSTSQPFLGSPSQSRWVASQTGLHTPAAQLVLIAPAAEHATAQVPQWPSSVSGSTSQPVL